MRDSLELKPIAPATENNISESTSREQVLDWKSALTVSLCKTNNSITTERAWARLCENMRHLCPETQWLSICEESNEVEQDQNIHAISFWLRALVATPEWPFPESVIMMSSKEGDSHTWKIIFSKDLTKLPYVTPPNGLTITPWRNNHSSGWKIIAVDSFNVSKAGEA